MRLKRMLSTLIILTLLLALFTSCTTEKAKTPDVSSTDKVQEKEPPMVLTASMNSAGSKYYETMADTSNDKYIKKLEELSNVRLDLIVREHSKDQELINLMFASKEVPDILGGNLTHTIVKQAIENGIFMNLKPYINKDNTPNLMTFMPEEYWQYLDELKDGGIYWFPMLNARANHAVFIREDLLKKFNLEVPVTLDDYTNVMRVFKENGVKYPIIARENVSNLNAITIAFGILTNRYVLTEAGKIEPAAIQPRTKEMIAYLKMIYDEGLLDPEFLTNSLDPFTNKIMNGDVGIFCHSINNYPMWQQGIEKNLPDAKFKMILGPVGPDGKMGIEHGMQPVSGTGTLVNKNVKDPARVARFFDWMCTDEAAEFFSYGIEGDTYTKTNGKINFAYPTTAEEEDELTARTYSLWRVRDTLENNPLLAPYIPYAEYMQEYRNEIVESDCIFQPVSLADKRAFCPSFPIARDN
jgi:putative aldouronate transport system substrate-binding protein